MSKDWGPCIRKGEELVRIKELPVLGGMISVLSLKWITLSTFRTHGCQKVRERSKVDLPLQRSRGSPSHRFVNPYNGIDFGCLVGDPRG